MELATRHALPGKPGGFVSGFDQCVANLVPKVAWSRTGTKRIESFPALFGVYYKILGTSLFWLSQSRDQTWCRIREVQGVGYKHGAKANARGPSEWYGEELDQAMEVWNEDIWMEAHNAGGEFVLDKDAFWVRSGLLPLWLQ